MLKGAFWRFLSASWFGLPRIQMMAVQFWNPETIHPTGSWSLIRPSDKAKTAQTSSAFRWRSWLVHLIQFHCLDSSCSFFSLYFNYFPVSNSFVRSRVDPIHSIVSFCFLIATVPKYSRTSKYAETARRLIYSSTKVDNHWLTNSCFERVASIRVVRFIVLSLDNLKL